MLRNLFLFCCLFGTVFSRETHVLAPKGPWFTGPLLAPSESTIEPGHWNTEPYLFVTATPARYDNDWHAVDRPTFWNINLQVPVWVGLTSWADLQIQPTLNYNHRNGGPTNWSLGDFWIQLDLQLHRSSLESNSWLPSVKLGIREILPIGKYRNFTPSKAGTQQGGNGSWITVFSLVFGKINHFYGAHYLHSRLSFAYNLPSPVHVKGVNAFGGAPLTNGTVYPPNSFNIDVGFEYSLTQEWSLAIDLVGRWDSHSRFKNRLSTPAAPNTVPALIQYSIAPAIEYNWNESLGIVVGPWFSVAGKNAADFFSFVFALNYYK